MLSAAGSFLGENGGMTVAVVSALVSAALSFIPVRPLKWLLVITAPLPIALALYWAPTWGGGDASEYSAWVLALVVPWYVGGVVASALVCVVIERLRAGKAR